MKGTTYHCIKVKQINRLRIHEMHNKTYIKEELNKISNTIMYRRKYQKHDEKRLFKSILKDYS